MTDSGGAKRVRKLTFGKIQSEQADVLTLGLTEGGGRRVQADVPMGVNVLAIGHGVPHLGRLLETVIAHYRAFDVPIYGIDLFPILGEFSRKLFAAVPTPRADPGGIQLINRLVTAGEPVALLLARADVGFRAEEAGGPFETAVLAAAAAPHIALYITCYESAKAADLPQAVIDTANVRIALGKLFTAEAERIMGEAEVQAMRKASLKSSLLVDQGVFQHDHATFTEDFQVTIPGTARYL